LLTGLGQTVAVSSTDDEIILKGGRANAGNVVRIGDQVARPTYEQTPSVDHFLRSMVAAGVSFVPKPIGFDSQGRHRLSFITGTAPTPPYPDWAFDEALLANVALLQRQLHEAARGYESPAHAVWAVSAGNYFPPQASAASELIVCHNDLGMTNVIVDPNLQVTGFIDFDYCRPVDPLFDVAVAIRHWAPFGDLDLAEGRELDRVRRFGIFCSVHELDSGERARVVELAIAFLEHARDNLKALAAGGHVGFQTLLGNGYEETNRRTVNWILDHTDALVATAPS